jgi:Xaa-Pro aminopeptidase
MSKINQRKLQLSALKRRKKAVRERLKRRNLDALLVSSPSNKFYLTNWRGDSESGMVLVTKKKSFIITDSRYTEHAVRESVDFEVIETNEGVGPTLREIIAKEKLSRLGYESHHLSIFSFKRTKKFLKGTKLIPVAHLIEEIRGVKENSEIANIEKSISIAEKTLKHILKFIRVGIREREVAWEMERYMRDKGAEKMAWDPFIVAAGKNASMAHWGASSTKIKKGDLVQLDYGCSYQGYVCDISRVIFIGKPSEEQKRIYSLVIEAQKLALSLVKSGRQAATIDKKVRSFLERHTKHFYRHALGHGVGLDVHEFPYLNINRKNKLEEGNVITIEPGIYIPGWGGVRIEDMVLVTKTGYRLLTKPPKKIEEVTV